MHELAPLAVGAELFLMELFTSFRHEILREMGLLDNFVSTVRVRAPVAPPANAFHLPVLAHLGLLLLLVLFNELVAVLFACSHAVLAFLKMDGATLDAVA